MWLILYQMGKQNAISISKAVLPNAEGRVESKRPQVINIYINSQYTKKSDDGLCLGFFWLL